MTEFMNMQCTTRRTFCKAALALAVPAALTGATDLRAADTPPTPFKLNYILASSLYGRLPLDQVVAAVRPAGAQTIDIWPESHANHREQVEAMGHDAFAQMLHDADVQLGIYTCYNPGLLRCESWMRTTRRLGGSMVIANAPGPHNLAGAQLKQHIKNFIEALKPNLDLARQLDMTIGVENHGGSLISSPDSIRWLGELAPSRHLGIALAPYHLAQDAPMIARLIEELGDNLVHFYAWEHGRGCMTKMPKLLEMKQLPGCGELDFTPIVAALKKINYQRWTSIFMHPVPRGIPILPTAEQVTQAHNRSREYLDECLKNA